MVAVIGVADILQMLIILGIVAGQLAVGIEVAEQLVAQNLLHFRHGGPGMKAVGDQQEDVLLLHAGTVQFFQAGGDGNLSMAGRLAAALNDIGDDNNNLAALVRHLGQGGHTDGIADAFQRFSVQSIPVLRQAFGIGDGNTRDKHISAVGQVGR